MDTYQIAELLDGKLEGPPDKTINRVGKIETALGDEITFISNPLYEKFFETTNAGAVIVSHDFNLKNKKKGTVLIRVQDPYRAFLTLLEKFSEDTEDNYSGISDYCILGSDVNIGDNVYVGDYVKIGDNCIIGDNTKIHAGCIIEHGVIIGNNCIIYPNVVIYRKCRLNNNIIIHSGTVIGSDGFGFAKQDDNSFKKIPQNGIVVIDDDVEVGSNCSIDRATLGETRLHRGVKLDNQIQIAHNVIIGEDTLIAAQVGIAGSTKIGKRCLIAGQAGIVGHITVCDDVIIGASVGVSKSITKPGLYSGYRARPNLENLRREASIKSLEAIASKIVNFFKDK